MLENFHMKEIKDSYGSPLHELWVDNGLLRFSLLLERGLEIGQVFLGDTCMSWNRDEGHKLHPDNVDLREEGWEKGFYSAVAVLGPEVFGTPDENVTVHGTGSYSKCDVNTLKVQVCGCIIQIEVNIPIQGYSNKQIHQKKIMIQTKLYSNFIMRKEVSKNVSENQVSIDDGYHLQFSGEYLSEGGSFILPVPTERMLLRDSAPVEEDPKAIYPIGQPFEPIRCYQYVPEKVYGLENHTDVEWIDFIHEKSKNLTAEMLVNNNRSKGTIIIRPLDCFPRTLIAKRNDGDAMYAIEPCKTRPNSLKQKAIDGELRYLAPGGEAESWIAFGFLEGEASIGYFEKLIESAACYEEKLVQALP